MANHHPSGDGALGKVLVAASGMGADEHDSGPPGATPDAVKAGHEADRFRVKPILYVPLLVSFTVIGAIAIISAIFFTMVERQDKPSEPDMSRSPMAAADANMNMNDRFARISSTDPKAAVPQPRLEYLKMTDMKDPAYYRSKLPMDMPTNTYEIRPEDLRPENFIDPTLRRKILIESAWIGNDKKFASIPIAEAIKAVIAGKKLPTRKDATKAVLVSDDKAKLSNGGRGGPSMPKVEIKAEPKKEAH